MILKIQNQVESGHGRYKVRASTVRKEVCSILKFKMLGLDRGLLISDNLIAEAESFINRNALENADFQCCQRCLKAHVIKKAKETGSTKDEIKFLDKVFTGEIGHNGYYMDGEQLYKANYLD